MMGGVWGEYEEVGGGENIEGIGYMVSDLLCF